ncbi:MAG: hypothetical protein EZS28_019444 [Streblomastix strix]|uniref:Uncharacterized protein n=1 Tax=Streblomastix strix TaxID=222440 RepID=A0A5J4VQT4_9EUKA|nr:MAG: hypothetical protein EZS28_019444 [Streblomastix strix]
MESEGIPERINKTIISPSEKTVTISYYTSHLKKLNSTADSLYRLCRSGYYTLKGGIIQMAFDNAIIAQRIYHKISKFKILFDYQIQSKQNKYLSNQELQVKIAFLLMSICVFRPNEIPEIRLKFSNANKTENQASLILAPKQANAIETNKIFETENEKLSPKLAELLPAEYANLQQQSQLNQVSPESILLLLHITPKTLVLSNDTIFWHPQQEQMTQLGNQFIIMAQIMKGQTRYLNNEVRQEEKIETNYYPCFPWRQGNDLLSAYHHISLPSHAQCVSQPDENLRQSTNSLQQC